MRLRTTLRFVLEVTSCEAVQRAARTDRSLDNHGRAQAGRSGTRTRCRLPLVLIVDDTEDNRDLYAMILGNIGYEVAVAVDGHEGVAMARSMTPAVILMDLAMPNLDGFDATRQIRETPELASVHIIAITAFADSRSRQRALAAGCNEVLTKPCAPGLLTACVAKGVHALRAVAAASSASSTSSNGADSANPISTTTPIRGELRLVANVGRTR